jgi:hypothetical protein
MGGEIGAWAAVNRIGIVTPSICASAKSKPLQAATFRSRLS